jgi:hypothetical protein
MPHLTFIGLDGHLDRSPKYEDEEATVEKWKGR